MRPLQSKHTGTGFTYIGLLIFVALMGIGLALAGQLWHASVQREKEDQLLFIGDQFRVAIGRYYQGTPSGLKKFPDSLDDLLDDKRSPTVMRHLRRIYSDPMTASTEWGLITAADGKIRGVHSLSARAPRKIHGFREPYEKFADAKSHADWQFIYATPETPEQANALRPDPAPGDVPPPGTGPAEPLPSPVPTPLSKDDPNRKAICARLLVSDQARCSLIDEIQGERAGNDCRQSALDRNSACREAERLPPLATTGSQQ